MNAVTLSVTVTLPRGTNAITAAGILRDAADRAAGQIEYAVLPWPLPVDETIELGSSAKGAEAQLFRSA